MRRIPILLIVSLGFFPARLAAQEHGHELSAEEVGSVQFATSCSKSVEQSFKRAVALLHSFQYERARGAFTEISKQDPSCAMAQWGVAMSHYHGFAHYIIHCYDNAVLAEKGLPAARMYAKIAPASAHANHMPSHLFTRVGSWEESITSNIKSEQLAAADERTSKNGEARDQRLHAMDYLEYAYLQSGQVKKAESVLEEMNALPPLSGLTLTGDYALAAIPARAAIELGNWQRASGLPVRKGAVPWAEAITWTAIGEGSARSGNLERAAQSEQTLASLRDAAWKLNNVYWANQIEVQRREVAAWISEKAGNKSEAFSKMQSAVELEETMDKDAVTPGAVMPAREMLAELYSLENKPKESLAEYEAVLKVAPNRFSAVYGAARAAEASGNNEIAKRYYQKLTEISPGDERSKAPVRVASTSSSN